MLTKADPPNTKFNAVFSEVAGQAAFPMAAQFGSTALKLVNIGLFGRLGTDALIAANPVNTAVSFYSALNALVFLLNNSIQRAIVRAQNGNADLQTVGVYFRQGLLMTAAITVGSSVIAYFTGDLFEFLGASPQVASLVDDYFHAFLRSAGMFPMLAILVERRLMAGIKKPIPATVLVASNAGLTLAFSLVTLKLEMGMSGFGYALSASNWISFLGFLGYLGLNKDFVPYSLFKASSLKELVQLDKWYEIAKEGVPVLASNTLECLIVAILSGVVGRSGEDASEAYTIANQIALFFVMPAWVLSVFMGTLATRAITSAEEDEKSGELTSSRLTNYRRYIQKQLYSGMVLAVGLPAIGLPLAFGIPKLIISLFSNPVSDSLLDISQKMLWIAGIGSLPDILRILCSAVERALKRDIRCFVYNAGSLTAGLTLGLLSQLAFGWGPLAMVGGFYAAIAAGALMQYADLETAIARFDPRSRILAEPETLPRRGCLLWIKHEPIAENRTRLLPVEAPNLNQDVLSFSHLNQTNSNSPR